MVMFHSRIIAIRGYERTTKRSIVFRQSTRNVPKLSGNLETEYLNTGFSPHKYSPITTF